MSSRRKPSFHRVQSCVSARKWAATATQNFAGNSRKRKDRIDHVKQLPEDFRDIHLFLDELEGGKYEDKLEEAASMIAKSEHIVLVGIGNSGKHRPVRAYRLSNMGKFSMFVSDPFIRRICLTARRAWPSFCPFQARLPRLSSQSTVSDSQAFSDYDQPEQGMTVRRRKCRI